MGLEANVLTFVAKSYGLNKKDSSSHLPPTVTSYVASEVAKCRSKGVLAAADIEAIAHRCFEKMSPKQQQHYNKHRHNAHVGLQPLDQKVFPNVANAAATNDTGKEGLISSSTAAAPTASNSNKKPPPPPSFNEAAADKSRLRPPVPKCGMRKNEPIRRHMAGPPRPASTSPTQHIPHKVEEYIKSVLRPSSQMNYATQNSFRRLQRQQMDADWHAHVLEEARKEKEEREKQQIRKVLEKQAMAEEVRKFYREKERSEEDKFLEREAERIESQQWYEHNCEMEKREKQRLAQKRKNEFQTFVDQAHEFRNKKEKEKSQHEQEESKFRREIERGIVEDKMIQRKKFTETRTAFVDSLKVGTEIARKHRQEEKQADKDFDKKLVADAKQVLATQKERDAEEKARRLTRVKKHEQLQDQAAEIYKQTVAAGERERQKQQEERTNREVEKVEEQYRQRRMNDKQHVVDMKKQLQSALKETVQVHEHQRDEMKKEEVREKKMVQESVKKEQLEAKKEVGLRREMKEKLKQQQEEDIVRRNQMLLRAPKLKITDRK